MTESLDTLAHSILRGVFKKTDAWQLRTSAPPRAVQPDSQLAGDDAATDYLQISHVALGGLLSAVDHLLALKALIDAARIMPSHALCTLARAAHENAAVVVWLLSPADRPERVRRRLSLALQDSRNATEMHLLVGSSSTHENRRRDIAAIAERSGLSFSAIPRFPGYESVVREVGELLGQAPIQLVLWKGCSGVAHGMQWSSLALLQHEERDADDGVATVRLTASTTTVASAATHAALVIEEGFRLLDHARLAWRSHGGSTGKP